MTADWALDRFSGQRPLTTNKVRTMHRMAWATHVRHEREAWRLLAIAHQIPPLDVVTLTVTPLHRDRRSPQDVAACAPEAKAAIDGLVDAGVIPDDDPTHLLAVTFMPPWICGADGLRIRITHAPVKENNAA